MGAGRQAMIESLFKELLPISDDGDGERQTEVESGDTSRLNDSSEESLLAALSAVRKIVRRKTLNSEQTDGAADIFQTIVLRLLKWRDKFRDKSEQMSPGEWQSVAARTAYNEINRYFSAKASFREVPLEDAAEIAAPQMVEGNSNAEVLSLARPLWQAICSLSLRQRRAFLLHSQKLIIILLQNEITDEELARALELKDQEWAEVKSRLSLFDHQIARLIIEKEGSGKSGKSVESLTKSIKKARHEARRKLRIPTRK